MCVHINIGDYFIFFNVTTIVNVDYNLLILFVRAILNSSCFLFQEVQRRISERTHLLRRSNSESEEEQAIGFFKACCIPGVLEFSFALFFSKLVSYTFLSWLAVYVKASSK